MTRWAVLGSGVLGLALVARAALFYRGVDPLAFSLVLLVAFGLVLGVVELVGRARRAAFVEHALSQLSASPDRAEIDASPQPLRGILVARLAGTPAGLGHAVFTPYLLGLLVTIGLLGTFMGLFDTLRGAREALTSSGDVLALREGLAAPMKGLSRAFGTSAAGVSASAMLGLAAVFVRRAESRVSSALATLLSGSLFPLTIAGRNLAALEALAQNREALPKAARAMERATARLESIEKRLVASTEASSNAMRDASLASARAMTEASERSVDALREHAVLTAQSLKEQGEATTDALREHGEAMTKTLREHGEATHETLREHGEAVTKTLHEQGEATYTILREQGELAHLTMSELVGAAAASVRATGELTSRALREEGERSVSALREQGVVATSAFREAAQAIRADLRAGVTAAAESVAPLVERAVERAGDAAHREISAWTERLAADGEARRLEERAHQAELAALAEAGVTALRAQEIARAEALTVTLEDLADRVGARLEALGEREAATAATVGARLDAVVRGVDEARARADQRDDERLARVSLVASSIDAQARAIAEASAREGERARAADLAREDAVVSLLAGVDAKLEAHLGALGERLAGPLGDAARATQAGPEAVRELLVADRERIAARAQADAERDARLDALVASIDRVSQALARRSEEQAERVAELDGRLERERSEAAVALSGKLATHADGVAESLRATADLVRDAATVVHAGGTEMGAVAEMFTSAVDRYCGASEKWLDSLSLLEAAVEKRGGHDEAADLLGAYLDQTREVFDHSMAFQRELFTELRALRAKRAD